MRSQKILALASYLEVMVRAAGFGKAGCRAGRGGEDDLMTGARFWTAAGLTFGGGGARTVNPPCWGACDVLCSGPGDVMAGGGGAIAPGGYDGTGRALIVVCAAAGAGGNVVGGTRGAAGGKRTYGCARGVAGRNRGVAGRKLE